MYHLPMIIFTFFTSLFFLNRLDYQYQIWHWTLKKKNKMLYHEMYADVIYFCRSYCLYCLNRQRWSTVVDIDTWTFNINIFVSNFLTNLFSLFSILVNLVCFPTWCEKKTILIYKWLKFVYLLTAQTKIVHLRKQ